MAEFLVVTIPYRKQSQSLESIPMIKYEFISSRDTAAIDRMMRKLWLLGIHGDGYMRDTLRSFWVQGDNVSADISNSFDIVVATTDGMIVGAVLHEHHLATVDTYVTVKHRRLGIASAMIAFLRAKVGDRKVLSGWTGMKSGDWKAYYAKNHICWLDFPITKEDAILHGGGDRQVAWERMAKSAKLKTSAAYRKSLKAA